MIPHWQQRGYAVELIFLSLPTVELALARVAARVEQGGHNVPEAVVRRRFTAGLANFHRRYKPLVDTWFLYDNSVSPPELVEAGSQS